MGLILVDQSFLYEIFIIFTHYNGNAWLLKTEKAKFGQLQLTLTNKSNLTYSCLKACQNEILATFHAIIVS